jgi:mannose-6-phosphate isomerase-like protein (cupin superfamily)
MKQSYKTPQAAGKETCLFHRNKRIVMTQAIDLHAKLASFEGHWQPRTVSEFNGHDVMVVKVQGEYTWHSHPESDDFFLVLKGELHIDIEGQPTVVLKPGHLYVVPRGVRHRPRARRKRTCC